MYVVCTYMHFVNETSYCRKVEKRPKPSARIVQYMADQEDVRI